MADSCPAPLAAITTHAELVAAFRARIAGLDVTHEGVDIVVGGLAEGHTVQLEAVRSISLFALLDALGCDLVLVENPAKLAAAEQAAPRLHVEKAPRRLSTTPGRSPARQHRRATFRAFLTIPVQGWAYTS
jgi:hypothetical protein